MTSINVEWRTVTSSLNKIPRSYRRYQPICTWNEFGTVSGAVRRVPRTYTATGALRRYVRSEKFSRFVDHVISVWQTPIPSANTELIVNSCPRIFTRGESTRRNLSTRGSPGSRGYFSYLQSYAAGFRCERETLYRARRNVLFGARELFASFHTSMGKVGGETEEFFVWFFVGNVSEQKKIY